MNTLSLWIHALFPNKWLKLLIIGIAGMGIGLSLLAIHSSKALSYLSEEPKTCMNCHVMSTQYATWQHSSHRIHATCNDCHVPHDSFIRHYWFKMKDGLRHATIFTLRQEPQAIEIKPEGSDAVQKNCRRCHETLIHRTTILADNDAYNHSLDATHQQKCWDCHRFSPHGKTRSLASTPFAQVPKLKPIIPDWLETLLPK